ncbi:suppressor of fused domain protein [Stenotrophomonas maltophilia]|uniref:suppressor of fused domain protein n=1 Tax=Stenotrophomonas maltophilia TaxID=40324 RepID=UPI0005B6F544|nr:suppressor of fused domain protein [Stenotrophomonas maltophilia]KIS40399.1 suppressor of fused [Stenotrophomonas maltophilia WJ66]MCF3460353.1 suppressor of fused domain protein [Stenotrophomonas maltophilia]MCF3517222.1 suppressor of fused domain protein [Stenotrophomonas maltophilia]UXB29018.1 suppressor of fused domain protein [Stenotrophomonas maltophilia]
MQDDHDDTDTPGWDAINAALAPLYAGQEPRHYGTALPYTLGGQDPLDGVSVYWADAPVPHWHYITYGFSELYAKESSDADASGYGFELTFRLAAEAGEHAGSTPPVWPMNLLQNLARYVFGSGNVFEDGHHLNANGPIALETGTRLCHLAFIADPQLPARDTANGHLQFLQLVGLTDEEMEAVKRWSTRGVLQALQPAMPLWISDLHRGNLLEDPTLAAQVRAGSEREGSSTGMLFIETLDWRQEVGVTTLVLGAGQVASVCELLPLRLRHGKSLELASRERQWEFIPAARGETGEVSADSARWALDETGLQALAGVRAERGIYPVAGALRIEVVPTYLRDANGEVIRQIG